MTKRSRLSQRAFVGSYIELADTDPGVLITKAEYERAIHKLIVGVTPGVTRTILEA